TLLKQCTTSRSTSFGTSRSVECLTNVNSSLHRLSRGETDIPTGADGSNDEPSQCTLPNSDIYRGDENGSRTEGTLGFPFRGGHSLPQPPTAETAPSFVSTSPEGSSAGGRTRSEGLPPAARRPDGTVEGGLQEPSTEQPRENAIPQVGATTLSTHAADGGDGGGTITTTSGPSGGSDTKSNDGQAPQSAPSHAPENVGGVPISSATPTSEKPNASAEENVADLQTAADAGSGHDAPSDATATLTDGATDIFERSTSQAPGQPGVPPAPGAAAHFNNGSLRSTNFTGLLRMNTSGDDTVRGCVPRLLLPALLGLWGMACFFA
ncbi:hypothetical protein TraAM80_10143, partial [Trypanosoma rangeli]